MQYQIQHHYRLNYKRIITVGWGMQLLYNSIVAIGLFRRLLFFLNRNSIPNTLHYVQSEMCHMHTPDSKFLPSEKSTSGIRLPRRQVGWQSNPFLLARLNTVREGITPSFHQIQIASASQHTCLFVWRTSHCNRSTI
jgi:hypothetical protein